MTAAHPALELSASTTGSKRPGALLLVGASRRDVILRTVADAGANSCFLEPPPGAPLSDNLVETSREAVAWLLGAGMIPRRV